MKIYAAVISIIMIVFLGLFWKTLSQLGNNDIGIYAGLASIFTYLIYKDFYNEK